jgi:hypothetical protein
MPEADATLKSLLTKRWGESASFFERAEKEVSEPSSIGFRALFASVPRRLGSVARQPLAETVPELPAARPHWTVTDLARLWLLLRGIRGVSTSEQASWVLALFEAGEIGEQVSILRTLAALPEPQRFVETGEQACRHNSLGVFEAIVTENPFLAAYFPPRSFHQAVMKAIFLEVSVKRIEGLEQRITPELSRMAADYASERRAAGRPVPEDATYLSQYGA